MTRGLGFLIFGFVFLFAAVSASAQSSDQQFPTPVRTSEIVGTIKARDVGDSRLTTYFYTFEGEQGDLFINVQSKNFAGDVDVFVTSGLRPLTKVVMYADQPESETGRVIYLRKPERLLLRVQGRTPGDDDATVRIKFAGSFAVSKLNHSGEPDVPKVESSADSNIRVNSVGTILEVIPKAEPSLEATAENREDGNKKAGTESKETDPLNSNAGASENEVKAEQPRIAEIVSDKAAAETSADAPKTPPTTNRRNRRTRSQSPPTTVQEPEAASPETAPRSRRRNRASSVKREEEAKVDPMAGIRLVVYFKDGSTIERPMTEVQRFAVERAMLTVISKNGTIGRYNMTDVARVSIE